MQAQVYDALREAMMSGRFRPGEAVSLRPVAEALGAGLTPVREALRRLESEGGLTAQGANRILTVPTMTRTELFEVRDIRLQLEGMACEAAAERMDRTHLRLIRNACELMQKAADARAFDQYLAFNWRFHLLIYRASGRGVLCGLIEGLWMRVGPLIRLGLDRPGHLEQSMACHWIAEEALRRGDAAAAREAVTRDIAGAAADLGAALDPA